MVTDKVQEVRISCLSTIMSESAERIRNIELTAEVADHILNRLISDNNDIPSDDIDDLQISLSVYGKEVEISNVHNKPLYNALIMTLTDLYGSGDREKDYRDRVKYTFYKNRNDYKNRVDIVARVSTEITGCKLIQKEVDIPERVLPAHKETQTDIVCE
jgi:hypothetical protein